MSRVAISIPSINGNMTDTPWFGAVALLLPEALHVDNGADFRSRAFERTCHNDGMQIRWRPIGNHNGQVQMLPGLTFSNLADRAITNRLQARA